MIGEKCYLSPMSTEYADLYTKWLNDPEVADNLSVFSANITYDSEIEFLQKLSREHNYSIVVNENDQLIGAIGLTSVDHLHRTAEIGIFIGEKSYWNKGYGEEAMRLLLKYSFSHLNLRNVMLRVFSYNERAIRCYEKIGFKIIGKRRCSLQFDMKEHDIIFMDILNTELI